MTDRSLCEREMAARPPLPLSYCIKLFFRVTPFSNSILPRVSVCAAYLHVYSCGLSLSAALGVSVGAEVLSIFRQTQRGLCVLTAANTISSHA